MTKHRLERQGRGVEVSLLPPRGVLRSSTCYTIHRNYVTMRPSPRRFLRVLAYHQLCLRPEDIPLAPEPLADHTPERHHHRTIGHHRLESPKTLRGRGDGEAMMTHLRIHQHLEARLILSPSDQSLPQMIHDSGRMNRLGRLGSGGQCKQTRWQNSVKDGPLG